MNSRQFRLLSGGVLVVALALLAPAWAGDQPTVPEQSRLSRVIDRLAAHLPVRIIAFGSSSTKGVGASSPAASYPTRLQAALTAAWPAPGSVVVLNRGVGGEDADAMALRLPAMIAEHPDLIIWQTGSNDPLDGLPLDRFVRDTIAGIEAIRAAHIDVMLMEPQLCHELDGMPSAIRYRDAVRAIGAEMNVPVIRRHDLMRGWLSGGVLTAAQMLAPDGLHMTDGGYAKLAEWIAGDILHRTEPPRVAMDSPLHR
jgi:acyl-CoA thioesterase-1